MAFSADCDRSIVWAKLSLIPDVKVPTAPLPPAIIATIANAMFKEETAQAFHDLKSKNFSLEMQEAAIAIVQRIATWHIPRLITDPIFKNRENKFMGSADEFFLLCIYLLHCSHDAHNTSALSSPHGSEHPTSPFSDALKVCEKRKMLGILTDDKWGISMSQEELDTYMQSCESTEVEPESPMSTQLMRRKKIMSQHECREPWQDDEWTEDAVDFAENGSESPMSKALRCRNNMFMQINDNNDSNEYQDERAEHASDSSPMSTNLLKRKKQLSLWGTGIDAREDREFFLAQADNANDDDTGAPSPMSRALQSKARNYPISHGRQEDEGPTMIDLLIQGKN